MEIDNLTVKQIKEIAALAAGLGGLTARPKHSTEPVVGEAVIVRSRGQGVMWGYYVGRDGANVRLSDAVQMWRWKAKEGGTLVDCAHTGVDPAGCKFSVGVADIEILNACAIIDVSSTALETLLSVKGEDWS